MKMCQFKLMTLAITLTLDNGSSASVNNKTKNLFFFILCSNL